MTRLIDADALKEWLTEVLPKSSTADTALNALDDMPTIEERKTGKWIDDICSECGQYVYQGDSNNYCPNCGARMVKDGGNNQM